MVHCTRTHWVSNDILMYLIQWRFNTMARNGMRKELLSMKLNKYCIHVQAHHMFVIYTQKSLPYPMFTKYQVAIETYSETSL